MRSNHTRGPDKAHLLHFVLARLRDRGWYSAHQAAAATYLGNGRIHPQQRKRIRQVLDMYVQARILERSDLWQCPLYRHRDVTLEEVDQEMVKEFEAHANRRRMTPSYEMNLKLLDHHLDEIVPRNADPELFNEYGHLMDRELKAWRERVRIEPEKPRVLGYLKAGALI